MNSRLCLQLLLFPTAEVFICEIFFRKKTVLIDNQITLDCSNYWFSDDGNLVNSAFQNLDLKNHIRDERILFKNCLPPVTVIPKKQWFWHFFLSRKTRDIFPTNFLIYHRTFLENFLCTTKIVTFIRKPQKRPKMLSIIKKNENMNC